MSRVRILAATWVLAVGAGCSSSPEDGPPVRLEGYRPATVEDLRAAGWRTDLSRLSIPAGDILMAPISPVSFVPIDSPRHAAAEAVDLDPAEPVLIARGEREVRAWPLVHLLERELALDEHEGAPVVVTFCSLCSTARVFDRRLGDDLLDLAVSGLLLHGNSLLFDRRTESLWRQIDGAAIAGAHAGEHLVEVPSFVMSFGELQRARPDAIVMLEPQPLRGPPITRIRAENVSRGQPPDWLALSCPRPLDLMLAARGLDDLVEITGARVQNLPGVVIFRDAACAAPYRSADGRAGAVTGSAAAFIRELDGRQLTFTLDGPDLVDRETGSRWSLLGEAIEGPLAGRRLRIAPLVQGFRYALDRS